MSIQKDAVVFVLASAAVVSAAVWLINWRGNRIRRFRFAERSELSEGEWFSTFLPVSADQQRLLAEVLSVLAKEMGIKWTQLRPDDTFSGTLRFPWPFWSVDDLDHFENWVTTWCRKNRIDHRTFAPMKDQLLMFLRQILDACESRPKRDATAP